MLPFAEGFEADAGGFVSVSVNDILKIHAVTRDPAIAAIRRSRFGVILQPVFDGNGVWIATLFCRRLYDDGKPRPVCDVDRRFQRHGVIARHQADGGDRRGKAAADGRIGAAVLIDLYFVTVARFGDVKGDGGYPVVGRRREEVRKILDRLRRAVFIEAVPIDGAQRVILIDALAGARGGGVVYDAVAESALFVGDIEIASVSSPVGSPAVADYPGAVPLRRITRREVFLRVVVVPADDRHRMIGTKCYCGTVDIIIAIL